MPGGLPDAYRYSRLPGIDRQRFDEGSGAPGQGGFAVSVYSGADVSRALSESLSPRAGGRRNRHLPYARPRRRDMFARPAASLSTGPANRQKDRYHWFWPRRFNLRLLPG